MTTVIKVQKIGKSLGLLLPEKAAKELGAEAGTSLYLFKTPEGRFYLTPADPEFEKQMAIAKQGIRRYRKTLRKLAT
jgi:putative addiction module antidote